MMTTKKLLALFLVMIMSVSMIACSAPAVDAPEADAPAADAPAADAPAADGGKDTLTVVLAGDPHTLDPNTSDSFYPYQVTRQIYETLFVYDENYEIQPWLCESYEYEDDLTIIMKIRQGVYFHNGDELKASDVLFTFQRILDQNLGGGMIDIANIDIDKCEVLDDYTLKYVTTVPSASQIALLEGPASAIISERAYKEANGDWLNGASVGTGPYKLVDYYPGDRVELTANENYWREGEPKTKNLVIRNISEATSRAIEAESLGADLVYDISAHDVERVDAAEGVSIVEELGTNTSHLLFNTAKAPLDNPLVREAIWYAIDAEAAVKLAYGDFGSFTQGWVCPGILGYDKSITDTYMVERDVEKAKALLAEAGYPNGIDIEIAAGTDNQQRMDMSEAFQAQMAEAGINVTINAMESSVWNEYVVTGQHQLTIYGFSCADFEADRALNQLMPFHNNYTLCSYDNPEYQATVEAATSTMDTEARAQLYADASELLMKDHITLPLWHKALAVAVSDEVEDFRITRSYEHHYLQYPYFK